MDKQNFLEFKLRHNAVEVYRNINTFITYL